MKSRKICEIRVLSGNDEKTVLKPFEKEGFEIYEIGQTGNTKIFEIRVKNNNIEPIF